MSLAAMAAAGFRAFGAKGPAWLGRSPWAQLSAGFCSRSAAGAERPELPPRPTSARQQDGIRLAAGPRGRRALPDQPTGLVGQLPGGGGRQGPGQREMGSHPTRRPRGGGAQPGASYIRWGHRVSVSAKGTQSRTRCFLKSLAWALWHFGSAGHTREFQTGQPRKAQHCP